MLWSYTQEAAFHAYLFFLFVQGASDVARLAGRRFLWFAIIVLAMVATFLSLVPFHIFDPISFLMQAQGTNPAPDVVPMLREWDGGTGTFTLTGDSQIILDPSSASQLQTTARVFQQDLALTTGWTLAIQVSGDAGTGNFYLTLQTQSSAIGSEGYLFNVGDAVTISAHTATGVFYGTRTALQILSADPAHSSIPRGSAMDYPQYAERGFMLDVGRKFVPLNVLEDYVRLMAWYKMNDLQLHFNDNALGAGTGSDWQQQYAAFRLNSPAFPGLAAPGASYSQQDITNLVQFAREYGVTITPEIDTPAHALALTQYRPDLASTVYTKDLLDLNNPQTVPFVESLWQTFLPWFSTSQVNMGMDEYDTRDANGYRQYANTINAFLRQQGKTTRMWGSLSEMGGTVPVNTNIVIEDWNNSWANPVAMVQQGFNIINANDAQLYIVPHANYYHDYLDTRSIYDNWAPNIFSQTDPSLNLQPGNPHLLGGTFAVWNDQYSVTSVNDISERVVPAMPVVAEKIWNSSISGATYTQFEQMVSKIGLPPGTHLS
jgi:hexosaminidase